MKCPECGKEFTPAAVNQIYCSVRCGGRYRYKHKEKIQDYYPSITFNCAQCGRTVVTEAGSGDKRTRFCCQSCERKFWKHPGWESTSTMIMFHSAREYASWAGRHE